MSTGNLNPRVVHKHQLKPLVNDGGLVEVLQELDKLRDQDGEPNYELARSLLVILIDKMQAGDMLTWFPFTIIKSSDGYFDVSFRNIFSVKADNEEAGNSKINPAPQYFQDASLESLVAMVFTYIRNWKGVKPKLVHSDGTATKIVRPRLLSPAEQEA